MRTLDEGDPERYRDFVKNSGMERRKACSLIGFDKAFSPLRISKKKLVSIGWTKLLIIQPYMNQGNVAALLEAASTNTAAKLKKLLKGEDAVGNTHAAIRNFTPDLQTFFANKIEDAVLSRLRKELSKPEALAVYLKEYNDARQKFAAKAIKRRGGLEKKIHDLDAALGRILKRVYGGIGDHDKHLANYLQISAELQAVKAKLSMEPDNFTPVALLPVALRAYGNDLNTLAYSKADLVALS